MERQAEIERIKDAERKRMQEQLPPIQKEDISENIDKEIEKVIEKEEPRTVEPTVVTEKEVMKEETPVKTEEVANQEQQPTAIEEKKVEETQTSEVTPIVETTTVKEEPKVIEEKPKVSQFVKVIKISTKSQDVYKSFLDKIYSVSDNITLCRDYNNNVEIFVGPFDDDLSRDNIAQEYLNKYNISVEIYDYTTEEYDKRCNY
jgi:hypothetical protein